MSILLLGLLTGLDNFIVSAGFGTLQTRPWHRAGWLMAVVAAETLMPLAGFHLAGAASIEWLGAGLLVLTGILVAWGALQGQAHWPYAMVLAPVALSFDNLAAGAGLALTGFELSSAAAAGGIAAATGLAGLLAGRLATVRMAIPGQAILACCLLTVGLTELVG